MAVTAKLVRYVVVSTIVTVSESVFTMVNVKVSVTVACVVSVMTSGGAIDVELVDV